jgi:hypothetical protein
MLGLDSHNFDCGSHAPRRNRIAGNEPAAPDRDNKHVEIADLVEHFQRDGALPGDDGRIVVGMNEDALPFGNDGVDAVLAFGQRFCAWLPADIAMTPRRRSSSLNAESFTNAPRSLNEFVTCRFSYLTKTSAPVRPESFGAASIGVRSAAPASIRRAVSTSARVIVIDCLRVPAQLRSSHARSGAARRAILPGAMIGSTGRVRANQLSGNLAGDQPGRWRCRRRCLIP